MVRILKENGILNKENLTVCEIGSGPARNLQHIYNENPTTKFYANDLWEETVDYLGKDMKALYDEGRFEYTAMDTEDYVNSRNLKVDVFMSVSHLMHVQYDKGENIIKRVRDVWQPTYILISELGKDFETPEHPRLYHDYTLFNEKYDVIHNEIRQEGRQINRLYRLKI